MRTESHRQSSHELLSELDGTLELDDGLLELDGLLLDDGMLDDGLLDIAENDEPVSDVAQLADDWLLALDGALLSSQVQYDPPMR